jgi:hypothetical protein
MAELYEQVLRSKDRQLIRSLPEILSPGFYMAGGTALALQIGHRQSEDFDFFSDREYSNETLKIQLNRIGAFHLFQDSPGTLEGRIDETRVTFLYYPYPRLEKGVTFESIGLASLLDIALMKLSAVSSRGSRKDFIDLYFLRNTYPVEDVSASFDRKYRDSGTNWYKQR